MMDDKTRERYAAIGRGQRLQWRSSQVLPWNGWEDGQNNPQLSDDSVEWRIAPPAPIPVELPRDVVLERLSSPRCVLITFATPEATTAFVDAVRKEQQK